MEELTQPQLKSVQKYLEVLYAKDGDLRIKYPDLEERRLYVAGKYLGNLSQDQIQDVLQLKDKQLVEMLIQHLRSTYSMEYVAMVSNEDLFYSLSAAMYEPLDELDADKKLKAVETQLKISASLSDLINRIDGLKKIVYSDVEEATVEQIKRLTVEGNAKRYKQGS